MDRLHINEESQICTFLNILVSYNVMAEDQLEEIKDLSKNVHTITVEVNPSESLAFEFKQEYGCKWVFDQKGKFLMWKLDDIIQECTFEEMVTDVLEGLDPSTKFIKLRYRN